MNNKILLLGAYPPPSGGNSIHIKRLKKLIDENTANLCIVLDIYNAAKEEDVGVIRTGPPGMYSFLRTCAYLFKSDFDILHIHVSAMGKFIYIGLILLLFVSIKTKKIITIHSGSFVKKSKKFGFVKMFLMKLLLHKFNCIITVSNEQKQFILDNNLNKNDLFTLPAFLPPEPEYSKELENLVNGLRADFDKLLITSGYGVPLYGYDKIITTINEQNKLNHNVALVICVYNTYDQDYMDRLLKQVADKSTVIFLRDLSAENFSYILNLSDVYVRATDRDGDAVAIREANHFNKPVVASNVVSRPQYCHLFDLNSQASLSDAINLSLVDESVSYGDDKIDSIILKINSIYGIKS